MKTPGGDLIFYVDSGRTCVFEYADCVKDVSRFAKSAPSVDQQWDPYYRSNTLGGCRQIVQGECRLDPTRDNASGTARKGGISESNHFSDFGRQGIVNARKIDKTRVL